MKNIKKRIISILLSATLITGVFAMSTGITSAENQQINYTFKGKNSNTAGYAEGTISFNANTSGKYTLCWADDTKPLDGYECIKEFEGSSTEFSFGYHSAIPAGATRIIAVNTTNDSFVAEYKIPANKQLLSDSGKKLYTFNSYSDIHIDNEKGNAPGYYTYCKERWVNALKFATKKNTDFIVTSGDSVTNAKEPDSEWEIYEHILADSDYTNPVWESDGNHDMRTGTNSGIKSYVVNSGTDSTKENYDKNCPYYYMVEPKTGDVFIFMALESEYHVNSSPQFSDEQMKWLQKLLDKYYGTGVNVYIIEHSPIYKFGAGDRMTNPYYLAPLSTEHDCTNKFKSILQNYKDIIFMSGHTHEDFAMGYNYSDENGTACNMIHNSAVVGSTLPLLPDDEKLDYNGGKGFNSQGYYTEVYDKYVVYYGADLTSGLINPSYCYIMNGAKRNIEEPTTTISTTQSTTFPTTSSTSTTSATTTTTVTTSTTTHTITTTQTTPTQPTVIYGDVNSDKSVDISDSTLVQKYVAGLVNLNNEQIKAAEVNGDNSVDVADATLIQRYVAGLVSSLPTTSQKSKALYISGENDVQSELTLIHQVLGSYYKFASYDQYQALKKVYYKYKNTTDNSTAIATELQTTLDNLYDIADYIVGSRYNVISDTYYFVNTKNWSKVNCYAWTGSNNNGAWPGIAINKVGTSDGHDVYMVKFASAGQYTNIIFNDGTNQTVDISLSEYSMNCFKLTGSTDSNGKYKVDNISYSDGGVISTTQTQSIPTNPASSSYTLNYVPTSSDINAGYTFKANIKDADGSYHSYTFVKTEQTYNGRSVYSVTVDSASYTNITKIQFQAYNNGTWVSQIVYENNTTTANINNKTMIASSSTSGNLTTI